MGVDMITQSEQEILSEISNSSRHALLDIHTVMGKVYDDDLALDLNLQAARYSRIEEKAADSLLAKGKFPAPISFAEKTKRWASMQANTALNVSTPHVAGMMIGKAEERLDDIKRIVEENAVIHNMVYEIAEEFMGFEEESIRILKSYL